MELLPWVLRASGAPRALLFLGGHPGVHRAATARDG